MEETIREGQSRACPATAQHPPFLCRRRSIFNDGSNANDHALWPVSASEYGEYFISEYTAISTPYVSGERRIPLQANVWRLPILYR